MPEMSVDEGRMRWFPLIEPARFEITGSRVLEQSYQNDA
jgi:hypothetical protein